MFAHQHEEVKCEVASYFVNFFLSSFNVVVVVVVVFSNSFGDGGGVVVKCCCSSIYFVFRFVALQIEH